MIECDLERFQIPRADHAVLPSAVATSQGRDHERRTDAKTIPGQIQRAIAFDEREQMPAAEAHPVILDRQIQQRFRRTSGRGPAGRAIVAVRPIRLSFSAADSMSSQR